MSAIEFTPDAHLTGAWRALKSYLLSELDTDIIDIVDGYPGMEVLKKELPLSKTVVHLDLEDHRQLQIGMGDNVMAFSYPLDEDDEEDGTVIEHEAVCWLLEFDLGIWSSAESGGVTGRMVALEGLSKALAGPAAYARCMAWTEGLEIKNFTGGRNVVDTINDITIWRTTEISLEVRVFARNLNTPIPFIDGFEVSPGIDLDGEVIIDDIPS